MQQPHPHEDGTSGQSLALQKFATLSLEDQLPILAFVLRDELSSTSRSTRRRARRMTPVAAPQPAVTAVAAPLAPAPVVPVAAVVPLAPIAPAAPVAPAAREKLQVIEADLTRELDAVRVGQTRKRSRRIATPVIEERTRRRSLSIMVTMGASFALAFGVMLWQRQPPVATASAVDSVAVPAAAAAPVEPGPPPPPAPAPTPSPATPAAGRNRPADAMPVTLHFRRRGFHADPGDRTKINWYMQGRVTNLSDTPMNIEVKVESAAALSASQIQIDVGAHAEREFGVDDGLEMHPGDKVTLLSAPYSDLVVGGVH